MEFFSKLGSFLGNRLMNSYNNSVIPGTVTAGQGLLAQLSQNPEAMSQANQNVPLTPENANYQIPKRQGKSQSQMVMMGATPPQLQPIGREISGSNAQQYQGGIPDILRSYGEPSVGLLKYIER
jgi:hypothetical protein